MITIQDKKDCCGCTACMHKCPKKCITMQTDSEGFRYPQVDLASCIECGVCEKVCPVLIAGTPHTPITLYAATNHNETVRKESSSGGVFTLLAEQVILEGGIVFGARFNDKWEVVHDYVEKKEDLALFRGSKYTQSNLDDSYPKVASFLKEGRKVLFSGTPCQIKGLKLYLRKEYENLITVDFICHGVPSPKVWSKYLAETCNKILGNSNANSCSIASIQFKNKKIGWKKPCFSITLNKEDEGGKRLEILCEHRDINSFMQVFSKDICLRPSCHACTARSGKSGSDIKVGDFWGIDKYYPEYFDNRGVSWVAVMSKKGATLLESIKQYGAFNECDFETSIKYNPSYHKSEIAHPKRKDFFEKFDTHSVEKLAKIYCMPTLKSRVIRRVKRIIKCLIGRK